MGRIKTSQIKRLTNELIRKHGHHFKPEFAENKVLVGRLTNLSSKKLRNVIAGYVTRLTKGKRA